MPYIPQNEQLQAILNQPLHQAGQMFAGPLAAATSVNQGDQQAAMQMLQLLSQADPRLLPQMLQASPQDLVALSKPAGPLAPKGGNILDHIVSTASRLSSHPKSPLLGQSPDKIAAFMKSTIESVGGLQAVMASKDPQGFMQAAMDYFSNPGSPEAAAAGQKMVSLMPSAEAVFNTSEKHNEEAQKQAGDIAKQKLVGEQALEQLAKKAEYDKILEGMKEKAAATKANMKPLPEATVTAWSKLGQLGGLIERLKKDWQAYAKNHSAAERVGVNLFAKGERALTGGEQDITSQFAPEAEPIIADTQALRGLIDQILTGGGRFAQQMYTRLGVVVPGLGENAQSALPKFSKLEAFASRAAEIRSAMQKEAAAMGYDVAELGKLQNVEGSVAESGPVDIQVPGIGLVRMETGKPPVVLQPEKK